VFSNFVVKYGDGTLVQVPVMYGDADRQVASIIRNNSENKVSNVPRIAIYVTSLALDRDRLADSTYVSKINIRERDTQIDDVVGSPTYGQEIYNQSQGRNYTVERLMPTPFKLTMKVDIWSSSAEQKLQILEQILVLFNPSLEIQTNDNYLDWTSLSVLNLNDINWSSKSVPVGVDTPIEIGTITVDTPIWISSPAKVKRLGVVTKIVTSMFNNASTSSTYIEGLGADPVSATTALTSLLDTNTTTIHNYKIEVYGNQVIALHPAENESTVNLTSDVGGISRQQPAISWLEIFATSGGKYVAGSSTIYLQQANGSFVVGTFVINSLDNTVLVVNWNPDTLTTNTGIDSNGVLEGSVGYTVPTYRNGTGNQGSPGNFDRIIDPLQFNPGTVAAGTRYLIIEDIGSVSNVTSAVEWGNLVALANDIIEYTGSRWKVIFNSSQETTTLVWQTNIYSGVQYLWNGVSWIKSYEGVYTADKWKIVL